MTSIAENDTWPAEHGLSEDDKQSNSSGAFEAFAELCDAIQSTHRKADKSILVASYFNSLSHHELIVAARCLAGYIFPIRENRILNVNSLIIINCLAACAGVPSSFIKDRLLSVGDLGNLASEIISSGVSIPLSENLTLASVIGVMNQLACISGARRKSEVITRLLRKASPLEAKYLVRIMLGDLEIGVHERDIEDSISLWKDISFNRIQSANMLLGDIGETALLVVNGRIEDARMRLFKPIQYMHALPTTPKDDLGRILPDQFIIEDKFDGIRAQVHIGLDVPSSETTSGVVYDGLRIVIFSDRLEDITADFRDLIPGLAALLTEQAGTVEAVGVIIDGEIVPLRDGKIVPFEELRRRLMTISNDNQSYGDIMVGFVAFDQMFGDGRSLIQEDWYTRAANLDKIRFDMVATFRVRSTITASIRDVETALSLAIARGSSGIMLKNPRSCYRPGRREKDWHKIYNPNSNESKRLEKGVEQ